MIYVKLFLEFFHIGLFSFGGGYATLPFLYHINNVKKAFDKQDRKDRVAYKLRKFKILEESIKNEDYCYAY